MAEGEIVWSMTGRARTPDGFEMLVEPTVRISGMVPSSIQRGGRSAMTLCRTVNEGRAWCAARLAEMRRALARSPDDGATDARG